jgi:hypothetical protein
MFWYIIVGVVCFVAGALVFRNNPVKGEFYAQAFDAQTASIAQKIMYWFSNLGKKSG